MQSSLAGLCVKGKRNSSRALSNPMTTQSIQVTAWLSPAGAVITVVDCQLGVDYSMLTCCKIIIVIAKFNAKGV